MGKFGWDLPPGCNLSDIPGNRPQDIAWEGMIENFFKELSEDEQQVADSCEELIIKAIEYGINVQIEEQKRVDEESRYYEEMAKDYLRDKEATQ